MTIAEVFVVLAVLGLLALGFRSYVPMWLLYSFPMLLALGAVQRAIDEGPSLQRVGGVLFYLLIIAAYVYTLRHRPPEG